MTTVYDILRRPIVTEKSNFQSGKLGQYVFEVAHRATKAQIKEAVETLFDVNVERVNVLTAPPKCSRRARRRRVAFRGAGRAPGQQPAAAPHPPGHHGAQPGAPAGEGRTVGTLGGNLGPAPGQGRHVRRGASAGGRGAP